MEERIGSKTAAEKGRNSTPESRNFQWYDHGGPTRI